MDITPCPALASLSFRSGRSDPWKSSRFKTYELIERIDADAQFLLLSLPRPVVTTHLRISGKHPPSELTVLLGYPCSFVGTSARNMPVAIKTRRNEEAADIVNASLGTSTYFASVRWEAAARI